MTRVNKKERSKKNSSKKNLPKKSSLKKQKAQKVTLPVTESALINLEKVGLSTLNAGLEISKTLADTYAKTGLVTLGIAEQQLKSFEPFITNPIFAKMAEDQLKTMTSFTSSPIFVKMAEDQLKTMTSFTSSPIFAKMAEDQLKTMTSFTSSPIFVKMAEDQLKTLSPITTGDLGSPFGIPASSLVGLTDFSENVLKEVNKNLLSVSNRYYSEPALEILKQPTRIPQEGRASDLAKRLQKCKIGDDWAEYQEICNDILSYCFDSELLEPFSQDETASGLHKRDFIFPFSREIHGFWKYVQNKFGMGLGIVVECKNHSEPLKENDIIITSKYLGTEKYTAFGLVISRQGVHENGMKAITNKWVKEKIMLLSLTDAELLKMLELKENDDESTKVIEDVMSKFLRSLD